jgi:cytochrome c peroxidase
MMFPVTRQFAYFLVCTSTAASGAEIERIWLTHQRHEPTHLVVNWETAEAGDSVVEFGPSPECEHTLRKDESVRLHHVEIPVPEPGKYHYRVRSGEQRSATHQFKFYPGDVLRIGVVADWQGQPSLDGLLKDDVHLLLAAGDLVASLHSNNLVGDKSNTEPFSNLIGRYPELFRSVPFLPVLGNHDREIRPRGDKPPAEPVYDVDATAFCSFFPLPGEGWKWSFDIPAFDVRFIALDFNHLSDQGTTWQTCHPLGKDSEQFRWYEPLSARRDRDFVITLYNEKNSSVRAQADGEWGRMIERGTAAITGFGYFAERAEVDGFPYFNTALGKGAKYRDPDSKFFAPVANYLLLTIGRDSDSMSIEVKDLKGQTLDRSQWKRRTTSAPAKKAMLLAPLPEKVPEPADNPTTPPKVELGKQLFFDPRLSGDNQTSCATCHAPEKAFGDALPTSRGIGGKSLLRNSQTVLNTGHYQSLFWDGRAASLEEQALAPLRSADEMSQDLAALERELRAIPAYARQFSEVFGKLPDSDGVAKALAAFQRTLVTGPAPLDRYLAGDKTALSAAAVQGLELFQGDAGCVRCHQGPLLSDGKYYRLHAGRPDDGRGSITGKAEDRGRMRTPSLRNIAETGPYLHDGSLATLEDVVTFYYRGINSPAGGLPADAEALVGQSFSEIPLLVEFLKSLSGKQPKIELPLLPSLVDGQDETLVSPASIDDRGVRTHVVQSPYQRGRTKIRVLLPGKLDERERYPVVFVLPVEKGEESQYGDGLAEVLKRDLHNQYTAIFVAPTFADLPWYADHPTNLQLRQEAYFLEVVVPIVERFYPVQTSTDARRLLGFSKSGWGAWSLLLRHPERFGRAVAWDAPLMLEAPGKFGSGEIFGTRANFESYQISKLLREARLGDERRLNLLGQGNFQREHEQVHELMAQLKIPHTYHVGQVRKHDWHSGWVADAVQLLLAP